MEVDEDKNIFWLITPKRMFPRSHDRGNMEFMHRLAVNT